MKMNDSLTWSMMYQLIYGMITWRYAHMHGMPCKNRNNPAVLISDIVTTDSNGHCSYMKPNLRDRPLCALGLQRTSSPILSLSHIVARTLHRLPLTGSAIEEAVLIVNIHNIDLRRRVIPRLTISMVSVLLDTHGLLAHLDIREELWQTRTPLQCMLLVYIDYD